MYHSVGIPNKEWQYSYLTIPYKIFEDQLNQITKKRFNTISLQELFDYMEKGTQLPANPIVLTFDDGYLDNWIFVYPLLKKYGAKATFYVNPDFVDSRRIIRQNLDDVMDGAAEIDELNKSGYLSWDEMKVMEEENVVDIQSHTMTHTWFPNSDKIIDFRHPEDKYIWQTWNNNPAEKPFLQIDNARFVNYGEPVYEHDRAIGIRRYYPDEHLTEFLLNYVKDCNCTYFFDTDNWRAELHAAVEKFKDGNKIDGIYETDEDYIERVYFELLRSKEIIETELDKSCKFLCWPGGAVTPEALKIAHDIGYISSTAGKDMRNVRRHMRNKPRSNPSRINRKATTLYWDGLESNTSIIRYCDGNYFLLLLYDKQDRLAISPTASIALISLKLLYKAKQKLFKGV